MKTERIARTAPNGKPISLILIEGDIWFSQKELSQFFSTTQQNISLHLNDIVARIGDAAVTSHIPVQQLEGEREVSRSIAHYSFECAHMIALRGHYWDELNWLVELAREVSGTKEYYRVLPLKERDFRELLLTLLDGIESVECQYQVGDHFLDFFLPDHGIAIEYDEAHHFRQPAVVADKKREEAIRRAIPSIHFIRVREGQELTKLNELLRILISNIEQCSGPDS